MIASPALTCDHPGQFTNSDGHVLVFDRGISANGPLAHTNVDRFGVQPGVALFRVFHFHYNTKPSPLTLLHLCTSDLLLAKFVAAPTRSRNCQTWR